MVAVLENQLQKGKPWRKSLIPSLVVPTLQKLAKRGATYAFEANLE